MKHISIMNIIIIGAGAAGLMAAHTLKKKGINPLILEARNRAGGRMFTGEWNNPEPPELGAEFIHGKLPITLDLIKKAGIKTSPVQGAFYRHTKDGLNKQGDFLTHTNEFLRKAKAEPQDISVAEFLENHFADDRYKDLRESLSNYVSGYYAGEIDRASLKALYEEYTKSDEEQYRIDGGYKTLVNYLQHDNTNYNEPVTQINLENKSLTTTKNIYKADKIIITIPISLWQNESIKFIPELPHKTKAARALGYGPVIRITMHFKERFWKDDAGFIFSSQDIPTWWTQNPRDNNILSGWAGGFHARKLEGLSEAQLKQKAIESLSNIFGKNQIEGNLIDFRFHDWNHDPWSEGAYSYQAVNGEYHQKILATPINNFLYIAGEGLSTKPDIGTVEAALRSGRDAALQAIG